MTVWRKRDQTKRGDAGGRTKRSRKNKDGVTSSEGEDSEGERTAEEGDAPRPTRRGLRSAPQTDEEDEADSDASDEDETSSGSEVELDGKNTNTSSQLSPYSLIIEQN